MVIINIVVSLRKYLSKKLYEKIVERKKNIRKRSFKKTWDTIKEIKSTTPKIIFKAHNIVVTLRNKTQLNRWLEIYPEGKYTINY